MKKISILILAIVFTASGLLNSLPASAATFDPSHIMSDAAFSDSGSMSAAQIDSFLNGFGSSCISPNKGFKAPSLSGYSPSTGFTYGGSVTAGNIIAEAASVYGLSPRVILATLQKEQSLVTGGGGICADPFTNTARKRYTAAMGYNCPDNITLHDYSGFELYRIGSTVVTSVSDTCVNRTSSAGFSRQLISAAWKLKFNEQRSKGNVAWDVQKPGWDNSDDPPTCYNGYMTPGTRARALNSGTSCDQAFSYDGRYTIDSTAVTMRTGATASLYYYTPHIHGNQNFFNIFVDWFGNPNNPCYGTDNVAGKPTGKQLLTNRYSSRDFLTYTKMNNTGSTCTEAHLMTSDFHRWAANLTTKIPAIDPTDGAMLFANVSGDSRDELIYIHINGSGGRVEFHILRSDYKEWILRRLTKLSSFNPNNGQVIAGDMNGDGRDELMYIKYTGADNRVEVHTWNSNFTGWSGHALTNLPSFNPNNGQVIAGDMNGDGRDELMYIKYTGADNRVEVHTWNRSYHSWVGHALTMLSTITSSNGKLVTGDMNGDGRDGMMYLKYSGANDRVEVHTMDGSYHRWTSHALTHLSGFSPN